MSRCRATVHSRRIVLGALVALLTACSTYDPPTSVSTDPAQRKVAILDTLEAFETGDEIYVVMSDGTSFRARYQGHGDVHLLAPPVMPGWKAVFTLGLSRRPREYALSEIEHVAPVRLTRLSKVVRASLVVATVAVFLSYVVDSPEDP